MSIAGRAQHSLAVVAEVAQSLLPKGWKAQASYRINADDVPLRITTDDRSTFMDVTGLMASDLYLSLDGLRELLKPLVLPAVEELSLIAQKQ